ncbi:MAG: ABC transporter ATP-binding protein [Anaerolineaceae bacterium]|nr:ABC transporter ATP-binding protein [Anaerolineaceae bacterium]
MNLAVEGLNAGYGKLNVLRDLSLSFAAGQFTAILGPNGSGKSTLLRSIFGLADVFSGSITLDGNPITDLNGAEIVSLGLACVPQRNNVFDELNVGENLQLATRRMDRRETARALEAAVELFPLVAKRRDQPACLLSGGERQMLAIAMGWLSRPTLMLLDEPSAGLAPNLVNDVFQTLLQLKDQGMTLVVVEQNARSALRHCDEVFILREGRLAFAGSAEACLQDEETIKSLLGTGNTGQTLPA